MKLPQLSYFFPVNEAMANLYGGWLEGPFFKIIFNEGTRLEQLQKAKSFLIENGFEIEISENDFNDEGEFEQDSLILTYNLLGTNMLLLIYEQPILVQPLDSLIELIRLFRDERDWKKFHTPKNLAMALSSEAGELLDLFLWDREDNPNKEKIANEIADIFIYLLLLSKGLEIDILKSAIEKIKKNDENYPADKARGTARKYNAL